MDAYNTDVRTQQLDRHLAAWHSVNQVWWTSMGIFAAANVLLIASEQAASVRVAIAGLGISIVWWIVQLRVVRHMNRHEFAVRRLEAALNIPDPDTTLRAGTDYMKFFGGSSRFSVRGTLRIVIPGVVIFWLAWITWATPLNGVDWALLARWMPLGVWIVGTLIVVGLGWQTRGLWFERKDE